MNGLLKKLAALQNSFEAVAHNTKFKNSDPKAEHIGDIKICERFAKMIAEIINAAESTREAIQEDLIAYVACFLCDLKYSVDMNQFQTDVCQIVVDNFNQPKVIENANQTSKKESTPQND